MVLSARLIREKCELFAHKIKYRRLDVVVS